MFSFFKKKKKEEVKSEFVDDVKKWFKNYFTEFVLIMYPPHEPQHIYFKNSIFLDTLEPLKEGVDIKKYYEIIKSKAEFYGVELILSAKVERAILKKELNVTPIEYQEKISEKLVVPLVRGKRIVINDKKQSKRVESIIRENGAGMTPPELHRVYESIYTQVPITSIRRAMTKLTDEGVLTMTGEKRMGDYNKTNFVWSLKNI